MTCGATWTKPGSVCVPLEETWTICPSIVECWELFFYGGGGRQVFFSERRIKHKGYTFVFFLFLLKEYIAPFFDTKELNEEVKQSQSC